MVCCKAATACGSALKPAGIVKSVSHCVCQSTAHQGLQAPLPAAAKWPAAQLWQAAAPPVEKEPAAQVCMKGSHCSVVRGRRFFAGVSSCQLSMHTHLLAWQDL